MRLAKLNEDMIPGGLSDDKTIHDVALHHDENEETLKARLEKGVKVELEHTSDEKIAREIAIDHLWEDPNYYDKLATIENFNNPKDRYMYNNPIMSRGIGTQDDNPRSISYDGGYPGSSTGGTRTSPGKTWPDKEDLASDRGSDDTKFDDVDNNLLDDETPEELKKSDYVPQIPKEPNNDWVNPKVAKHRGPGA